MPLTFRSNKNPDVLTCLANLSSDEVFTPPDVANRMLDLLPQGLFSNPFAKFLDPASKSGVFLREIVKRLIVGLEDKIPDLQKRVDHIMRYQVFGIAVTDLTAMMTRRTVYCSMNVKSEFSMSRFDDDEGRIRYRDGGHDYIRGKCRYCGASDKAETGEESHAYEFIHTERPEEIWGMKFDVVISNPPYQLNVGITNENFAIPMYHKFVEQAKKLNPKYIVMIIPARWYTGGRGLDNFRASMLNDNHIRKIVDFPDSRDCFSGVDIAGGVCYFLWDRDHQGECEFVSNRGDSTASTTRNLSEFHIFPRYDEALSIIHKVLAFREELMIKRVSVQTPFGFITTYKGKTKPFSGSVKLKTSTEYSYVGRDEVTKNADIIDKYKVIFGAATSEHGGTPGKDGKFKVFSSLEVLPPEVICTQSYFVADSFDTEEEAANLLSYLSTKFVRFLIMQSLTSQHISRASYCFVPVQDFSRRWTDADLYTKYSLTPDEISFIDSMIRPMNPEDSPNAR